MQLTECERLVRGSTNFGWKHCSESHGQILGTDGRTPLVNVWSSKKINPRKIKYQRCGTSDMSRVGTMQDAIRLASKVTQTKPGAPLEDKSRIGLRIGSVTVELDRYEWLQVIANIADALGAE